jgi:phosphatidylinositol alpha-mannosyltransferase
VTRAIARVALVSPYALGIFGGVQEQALAMSRELTRRGVEVMLVAPSSGGADAPDTPAQVRTFGSIVSMPANGSRAPITLSPSAMTAARDAIAGFRPDVVHFHEPFAPVIGYGALRAHDAAAVGTFHRSGGGPAYSLTRSLLTRLAKGLDESAAVSEAAASTILAGAGLRTTVLFNGFETDRLREFARESHETPTVLFIGRLEDRKGVMTLVEAVRRRQESGAAPWRVLIAGDGPLRERVERESEGVTGLELLGAVDDVTKRTLLRSADVAVAASTHGESFGMVILEAMAAETRVVVSDIDGYRQAAGGCAVLFEPGDAASLAAAIETALADSSGASIRAAREHAETWSMSTLMDRYMEIYERAVQRFEAAR